MLKTTVYDWYFGIDPIVIYILHELSLKQSFFTGILAMILLAESVSQPFCLVNSLVNINTTNCFIYQLSLYLYHIGCTQYYMNLIILYHQLKTALKSVLMCILYLIYFVNQSNVNGLETSVEVTF